MLQKKANFVLTGHIHETDVTSMNTLTGPRIDITAGSIFEKREWSSNSYNYVVFDTITQSGSVILRRYEDESGSGPEYQRDIKSTGEKGNGIANISIFNVAGDKRKPYNCFSDMITNQCDRLNRRPLLSESYPYRDSMDILFPDVYIDPLVNPTKHPVADPISLSSWINENLSGVKKVLILGPTGTGKTTSLIRILHDLAASFNTNVNESVPLYCEAREFDWDSTLDFASILSTQINNYMENPDSLNDSDIKQLKYLVLMDAIDEAFPGTYFEKKFLDIKKLLMEYPHVATSRIDFFEKHLNVSEFCDKYDEILILEPWQLPNEAKSFLTNYYRRKHPESYQTYVDEIYTLLNSAVEDYNLPVTALSITTFLFIWLYDRNEIIDNPIMSYSALLKKFLYVWASRECNTEACYVNHKEELYAIYKTVALYLFRNLRKGNNSFNQLVKHISSKHKINKKILSEDRGLISILRLRDKRKFGGKLEILSLSHEALLEYLLSETLVEELFSLKEEEGILSDLVGHSVNQSARQIINEKPEDHKIELLNLLRKKYEKARDDNNNMFSIAVEFLLNIFRKKKHIERLKYNRIVRRHNLCYYIGRIESEVNGEILSSLYKDLANGIIEDHAMIMSTVGSGILLTDNIELESDYLDKISNNSIWDICNRSYHKVYYGDSDYENPDTFTVDNFTADIDDWEKTRKAILKRLGKVDIRSKALRGLDLVTLRRLCESRGFTQFDDIECEKIRNCIIDLEGLSEKKQKRLLEDHEKVLYILGI